MPSPSISLMQNDFSGNSPPGSGAPLAALDRAVSVFRRHAAQGASQGTVLAPPAVVPKPESPFRRLSLPSVNPARVWDSLNALQPDGQWLQRNGLFPNASLDPASAAFDVLRTRIVQALGDRGWSRVAVTAPTAGCGTSFVAANLALSLARRPDSRAALVDLDLGKPSQSHLFGQPDAPALAEFLRSEQPLESQLVRLGRTLALGLNGQAVADPATVLHHPAFAGALEALREQLAPDVVLLDLPPVLGRDEVISVLPHVDAVLLVTDGTRTAPDHIRAVERLLAGRTPILGIVLNRAQDRPRSGWWWRR
jgi:Mrp family chromosome partitioning ATPase